MTRTRLLLLGGLGLAVAIGIGLGTTGPHAVSDRQPTDPAPGVRTDLYEVSWTTRTATRLAGAEAPLEASVRLDGTLAVTRGDVELWQLREVEHVRFVVSGRNLPLDAAALTTVVVHRADDRVRATGAADDTVAHLVEGLVQTAVANPQRTTRPTPYGVAAQTWAGTGDTRDRTTTDYLTLRADPAGHGTATVSGTGRLTLHEGHAERWQVEESLTVRRDGAEILTVQEQLTRTRLGAATTPVHLPVASATPVSADPKAPLEVRAASLSGAQLLEAVARFDGGADQATAELMWRGTARIALEPVLARQVARLAVATSTPHPRRELALDLLAHAPSAAAEQALVDALDADALSQDSAYATYVQRLGFVQRPGTPTVERVRALWEAPDAEVVRAVSHAAGGVARQALAAGDTATATLLADELRRRASQGGLDDRAAALAGLGNAARPEDAPFLLTHAGPDQPLRRAAALALRSFEGAEVRSALVSLVPDPATEVQRAALTALDRRDLTPDDLRGIAEARTTLAPANLELAATVLGRHVDDADAREVLSSIVAHEGASPRLRARVRSMLRP